MNLQSENTDIMPKQSIAAMVAAYENGLRLINQSFANVKTAEQILEAGFAGHFRTYNIFQYDAEKQIDEIKRAAWRRVLELSGIYDILSVKRREEVDKAIHDDSLPDFTEPNIESWIAATKADTDSMLEEAVKEVFDFLRPRHSDYKTNSEYEIGKKVIISGVFTDDGWLSFNHYKEPQIIALDRVLSMLDGKIIPRYPSRILDVIKANYKTAPGAEMELYRLKWYKAGTLHIEFRRMDLIARLNSIAGGLRLKHDNETQKSRKAG